MQEAEMDAVLEAARRHSHAIFTDHLHNLSSMLRNGELWATVDRGFARSLLVSSRVVAQGKSLGLALRRPHAVMVVIEALQLASILATVALGFLVFSWWGVLVAAVLPVYVFWCWRSAQLPSYRGRIPKIGVVICVAAAAYFAMQSSPWALSSFCVALAFVSAFALLRYAYAVRFVRRALMRHVELTGALIESGAVTLHWASELPQVRNRSF